ncbi:Mitogen-activated protein kinase kinase kinase YODA [Heracleum sosnowskyi]|uniref:mitogen-activated protein kinase kinase kinase n=1 Tax=Heracleum sosnowskyi TaxID=360622 RepID=A0AAD8MG93_9APIA|nr:Mitogen-activated protein kinase kinase kinase YODA [Heracleum sosnowskyi]
MSPQPLPLPELAALLRQDVALHLLLHRRILVPSMSLFRRLNLKMQLILQPQPLFSQSNALVFTFIEYKFGVLSQGGRRNTEHGETLAFRTSPGRPYGAEQNMNNRLSAPINIPNTAFSSPSFSPGNQAGEIFTSHHLSPPIFQAWSAPDLNSTDMLLGHDHFYHPYEITAISPDICPLHNPRLNFGQNAMSLNGPVSPFHRLSTDTSTTRRDSNNHTNVNVHPLPLPPTTPVASQPAPSPKVTAKPEKTRIHWKKGKLIGRGTFGSVYVGSNSETGALCAMKEVELLVDDPTSAECIKQLEQEIQVLRHLKHPNIVQYYGSETVGDRFYIYLEYVHPGSIVNYIRDHCGAITEPIVRNFTRHILSGLSYLHSRNTIHRDIKGANLLVDAYGVVKLADFGTAKHLSGQAANLSLKGSPYWMAPELLQPDMQKDADPVLALAVDIWSLGCTIIEMMTGKPPWSEYEGPAAMFKVLSVTPAVPESLSCEGKDLLHCCFRRNPAERPSANMLLEHGFMKHS